MTGHPGLIGNLLGYHFCESDEKTKLSLKLGEVNAFIHFALVCGANSCPPINVYTPDSIDKQLSISASSFVDDTTIIEGNKVSLSKLFYWYSGDFGDSIQQILSVISLLVGKSKRCQLLTLIKEGNYHIHYQEYDWSINGV